MTRTSTRRVCAALAVALAVSALLVSSGCTKPDDPGDPSWSRVEKRGALLVSVRLDRPPFTSSPDTQTKAVGFDLDYVEALGEQLGVPVKISASPEQDVIGDVLSEKADLGIGAYSADEAAALSLGTSAAYVEVPVYVAVAPDRKLVTSKEDLSGKVLGVISRSPYEKAVTGRKGGGGTKTYTDTAEAFADLKKGTIAALIIGRDRLAMGEALPSGVELLEEPYTTVPMVMLMRNGAPNLQRHIDSAVGALKGGGTSEMFDKWLGFVGAPEQ